LHRKLKASVKQSASKFIRNIRLNRAISLLHYTDLNISEVAYEVGFGDPKYFSRVFSQEFNQSPRSFRDQTEAAGNF
jgi:AraC-like DNA-binding protein